MALFNLFGKKEKADIPITDKAQALVSENDVSKDLESSNENEQLDTVTTKSLESIESVAAKAMFEKIRHGLAKTKAQLGNGIESLFLGAKTIDGDLFEELETLLLMADVGIDATQDILQRLTIEVDRKTLKDPQALYGTLRNILVDMVTPCVAPLDVDQQQGPFVILMVGVNGAGKTTTIGKLCKQLQSQDKSVMLAAGDTFRAAAVEQLQTWGGRQNVPVIAQHTGADSASVIFDAVQSAKAKGVDVIIADTAGRLQNKSNLMDELSKVERVIKKLDPHAPHEVLLVLDAATGQNALSQVSQFSNAVGVTGLVLTKLDGTAKGGIIFALAKHSPLPIRFIGVGEKAEDLRTFQAEAFIDALFDKSTTTSLHD